MVTTPPDQAVEDMGKLSALAGVREFPVRVKCASLAWHTLKAAMTQQAKVSRRNERSSCRMIPQEQPPTPDADHETDGARRGSGEDGGAASGDLRPR